MADWKHFPATESWERKFGSGILVVRKVHAAQLSLAGWTWQFIDHQGSRLTPLAPMKRMPELAMKKADQWADEFVAALRDKREPLPHADELLAPFSDDERRAIIKFAVEEYVRRDGTGLQELLAERAPHWRRHGAAEGNGE